MSGRILIIDTVATNRIVLKVKMLAAQYTVDACASGVEAKEIIQVNRPDLILINMADHVEDRHAFCREHKKAEETAGIPIIAIGAADTARARFAALDAGADDVQPRPMNDTLLLARIRSLLRVRNAGKELRLRDGTSRALGFEEEAADRLTPTSLAVLSNKAENGAVLSQMLQFGLRQNVNLIEADQVLAPTNISTDPDLFVIDAQQAGRDKDTLFRLMTDLRSRSETRLAAQLLVLPDGMPAVAAMALDLGADDVVCSSVSQPELCLRAKQLIRRKRQQDKLRDTVRNGLHAAVTDPLTGLYNRRYAEPHLARMADQACATGQAFAVMMLDIDHFKMINDRYGHPAGDRVLVDLADRLRENLRAIDLVARIGGEEFLVAMPQTTSEQAEAAAQRLRMLVNSKAFKVHDDGPSLSVTVSVGVAIGGGDQSDNLSLLGIFSRADAALYEAKSAGRNTVAMSRSAA